MTFRRLFLSLTAAALHCILTLAAYRGYAHELRVTDHHTVTRYTAKDGLVSSEVTGTYRDSRGLLWISTFNGISRFDGDVFENYTRQNGLAESNTQMLGEDDAGFVYALSIANVYRFTGSGKQAFVRFPVDGRFIATAVPDSVGRVWLAYDHQPGIVLLSHEGQLRRLLTVSQVISLEQGNDNVTYLLESTGQVSAIPDHKTMVPVHHLGTGQEPQPSPTFRLFKAAGSIWIYAADAPVAYRLENARIVDSIRVPAGNAWWQWTVGNSGRIYNPTADGGVDLAAGRSWKPYIPKDVIQGSLYQFSEDQNGSLWISSSSGLLHMRPKPYTSSSNAVGQSYFTLDTVGDYILKTDTALLQLPGVSAALKSLGSEAIISVYLARNRTAWFCTERNVYYLPYRRSLRRLPIDAFQAQVKADFRFRRIIEDREGGIWISSYKGVFYWKNGSVRYFFNKGGINEGALYSHAVDGWNDYYVAGIHVYGFCNDRFVDISEQLHLADEISRVTTDRNRRIWVCQGTNELIEIERTGNRYRKRRSIGLYCNGIPVSATSICFDAQNNLWVCDDKALYCYQRIGTQQQLTNPLYWDEQLAESPVLIAGAGQQIHIVFHPLSGNAIHTYDAGLLLKNYRRRAPQVMMTGILLNHDVFDWRAVTDTLNPLGVPERLYLAPDQNFLTFHFTGVTADFQQPVGFRYRLLGYDQRWSPVSGQGYAEYTGLPGGTYTLEITAISPGTGWSTPVRFDFTIETIWYKTWWAMICWGLIGLVILAGAGYLRLRVHSQRTKLRSMLVEEQLKSLRAQINPHFLQNTFAFLAHEMYAKDKQPGMIALDRISAYLTDVLRMSDRSRVTLEEEFEFAEDYLRMQQTIMSTPFEFQVTIDASIDTYDITVPSMLLQPILENALKYGISAAKKNFIHIGATSDAYYIKIVIQDSGAGYGARLASGTGSGMRLTSERMSLFYKDYKLKPILHLVENAEGGAAVTIAIPLQ